MNDGWKVNEWGIAKLTSFISEEKLFIEPSHEIRRLKGM